jgi:hypothetical protein
MNRKALNHLYIRLNKGFVSDWPSFNFSDIADKMDAVRQFVAIVLS